ncbi:MAG: hypothetical protein ACI8RD_010194, partial [Bacillariaceae sp.]
GVYYGCNGVNICLQTPFEHYFVIVVSMLLALSIVLLWTY